MSFELLLGDCLEVMATMAGDSVDAIVTDPPYGLKFMGKDWDHGVPGEHFWREALRVAKPGAHLLAFGGTRTFHRLACAIEDAGWEIRDTVMWVYSQGFPKGLDVAWEMHKLACSICGFMVEYDHDNEQAARILPKAEHEMRFVRAAYLQTPVYACAQCGQVLQPFLSEQESQEIRKAWTKSKLIWPEQSSMEGWSNLETTEGKLQGCEVCQMSHGILADGAQGWIHNGASSSDGTIPWQIANADGSCPSYRPQSSQQLHRQLDTFRVERQAQTRRGYNVALKPAWEPIIVARKPFAGTVAANVLAWGTGAVNVDGCRVSMSDHDAEVIRNAGGFMAEPHSQGRWPANVVHDGSEEVVGLFPESSVTGNRRIKNREQQDAASTPFTRGVNAPEYTDTGSAARFFYCAKADKGDRDEGCEGLAEREAKRTQAGGDDTRGRPTPINHNHHPTVKPTSLMRWLVRLVTPPGGVVLDPFMGSGSTGKACMMEDVGFVGIEMEEAYIEIARRRIEAGRLPLFAFAEEQPHGT